MNIPEIKLTIFSLCDETMLLNIRLVDKFCNNLLSNKDFWKQIFSSCNFLFDDKLNYTLANDWYCEFIKTKHATDYSNFIFNLLKLRKLHTVEETNLRNTIAYNDRGVIFKINPAADISALDIPNVNINKISSLLNKGITRKLTTLKLDNYDDYRLNEYYLSVRYINNKFTIYFWYGSIDILNQHIRKKRPIIINF
jgi:hypothetical protein